MFGFNVGNQGFSHCPFFTVIMAPTGVTYLKRNKLMETTVAFIVALWKAGFLRTFDVRQ